jgi:hypothetical protein
MVTLKFYVSWNGEPGAGIRSGSEDVSITFSHTDSVDSDTVEFFRESLREYYDGAEMVLTPDEVASMDRESDRLRDDVPHNWRTPVCPVCGGAHLYCGTLGGAQ